MHLQKSKPENFYDPSRSNINKVLVYTFIKYDTKNTSLQYVSFLLLTYHYNPYNLFK